MCLGGTCDSALCSRGTGPRQPSDMNHLRPQLLGALLGLVPTAASSAAVDDLRAADAAFAAYAAETSQRAAFIEYLADDAVLFRPEAVKGQEWLETHEPATGRLEWWSSAAVVACAGRIGVTTGPWRYSNDEGGEPAEGHYLTVWRLDDDRRWRVVLDHGIDHAPGMAPAAPLQPAFERLWPVDSADECTGRGDTRELVRAEEHLNTDIRRRGLSEALRLAAEEDALAYRDDAAPGLLAAVQPASDVIFGVGTVAQTGGTVLDADTDFAVTHGVLRSADGAQRSLYVRVWSRERRRWRVAIDMQTPLPAP